MLLEMMSLSETLVEWLTTHMNGLPRELIIFVISLLPILELRGGLLAASILGVPIVPALCICILERRLSQQACANVCGTTIILPARIADTVI